VRTTFFYVKNGARTHLKTARFLPRKRLFFLSLHRELEQSSLKIPKVKKTIHHGKAHSPLRQLPQAAFLPEDGGDIYPENYFLTPSY
jgi:hypothetical protein